MKHNKLANVKYHEYSVCCHSASFIHWLLQVVIYITVSILNMCKKSLKIPKGGNQNPYIEEEQTTQWPKEKVQKDKQRSTKYTYKTKDRVTRTH